jgi:hypothetical protein
MNAARVPVYATRDTVWKSRLCKGIVRASLPAERTGKAIVLAANF